MSIDTTSAHQHHDTSTHVAVETHAAEAHAQGAHHDAAADHANPKGGEVFTHLIDGLGDHHQLDIFFGQFPILPVMLVDDGFHFYSNVDEMEASGEYTLHHPNHKHKLVKTHTECTVNESVSPALDLSITNFVAYEFLAVAVVSILILIARKSYIFNPLKAPRGIQNVIESVVVYIRDEIVLPNVGTKKRADRMMPYITALFFFILALNLLGLMPGCHSATGALGVTAALAFTAFLVVNFISIKDGGIKSWFHHLLGGAPWYMALIMVPIEIVGLVTKPFALMIRLFANMTAGHIVLLSLVGLIFFFESWVVTPVSVSFSVFIYLLELLVAFLQAYIFAVLTSVFIGLALGEHVNHDKHAAESH
ncbi:MAG: F0F1 ATP synthase subunit A [Ignavibacteria bacterium]|nr:F0F1 ATP synthase subunit A [Ignavibacteria bacterium]